MDYLDYNEGVPAAPSRTAWLTLSSFDELVQHEEEILKRINALPNGPKLFMVHPFLLLADLGVELSDSVREEIVRIEPRLRALSALPYNALKRSGNRSLVRVRLHGLFKKGTT